MMGMDTIKDKVVLGLVGAVLGLGGGASWNAIHNPRPDPWTGSQARLAHEKLQSQIDNIEQTLATFRIVAEHNFTLRDHMYKDLKALKQKVYGHE